MAISSFARPLAALKAGNKGRVAIVQPPGVLLLGGEKRNVWPSTQFDAAALRMAGFQTSIILADAAAGGETLSWLELYRRSERLGRGFLEEAAPSIFQKLTARIAAVGADCVVVEANDWCEGARDLCNPALTLMLGDFLAEQGFRAIVVGPLPTIWPAAFARRYATVVVGAPGGALLKAVAGRRGVLCGTGAEYYRLLAPRLGDTDVAAADFNTTVASFGCGYGKCEFCPNARAFGPGIVPRPIDRVVEDLSLRPGDWITLIDPDFAARPDLPGLARRINACGRKYEFSVSSRLDAAVDPHVRTHWKSMNVKTVKLGFETFSDELLRKMRKNQSVKQSLAGIDVLLDDGFKVFAFVLLGYPGETRQTLAETLTVMEKLSGSVSWLPNIYCDGLDAEAQHYSRPQAKKLGLPLELADRCFQLAVEPRREPIHSLAARQHEHSLRERAAA
jgi:hypothetical protein